ncbi:MAG TPA: type II toxin-antitoxin system Phd/YefM family antitoxin [Oceanospirillales bacterium]|nr:type II toxin-antitoxin system Phd/YefM family antitoxin [Oceanospirillales bacterium]
MSITTVTSREFNQDISKSKKVCETGPVYVTNRGQPTHVLLTFEEYQKLVGLNNNIVDLLAMDDCNSEFEAPKLKGNLFNPADLT